MPAPVVEDFLYQRKDVQDQAKQQAKTALREKNKSEWQCDLEIVGNTRIVAGVTFDVIGFGEHDGKYIATTVTHSLEDGYTTKIQGHRALEGY